MLTPPYTTPIPWLYTSTSALADGNSTSFVPIHYYQEQSLGERFHLVEMSFNDFQ